MSIEKVGTRSVGRSFEKWRNITKSPEKEENLVYHKMKKVYGE